MSEVVERRPDSDTPAPGVGDVGHADLTTEGPSISIRGPVRSIGGLMVDYINGVGAEPPNNGKIALERPEVPIRKWPENLFAKELEKNPISSLREVRGSEGIFNVTVLRIKDKLFLFGRRVLEAAPWGQADKGALVLAELDDDRNIVFYSTVWDPEGKDIGIEDPRANQTENGTTIGVTAVSDEDGVVKTYPGIIELDSPEELLSNPFPKLRIFRRFGGGSQTTPLSGDVKGKNTTLMGEKRFIFRPDDMNHMLQVLEYSDDSNDNAVHAGFIKFPKNIPWALYKIGTTTTPKLLNNRERPERSEGNVREFFFKIHGLNKTRDGQIVDPNTSDDGSLKYRYGIGTARLLRWEKIDSNGQKVVSFSVDNISIKPIIDPDTFPPLTDGRQKELHPDKRDAAYLLGDIPTRNADGELVQEELFPSEGDKRTHNGMLDVAAIVAGWDRTIPDEYPLAIAA